MRDFILGRGDPCPGPEDRHPRRSGLSRPQPVRGLRPGAPGSRTSPVARHACSVGRPWSAHGSSRTP